jgi:glycosyltransferase involved in cell wall biosynthesis
LPSVTIGVCVRNCAATIREAVESIMMQDYPHELMEVIFVDDGSEDNTFSIIKEYAIKMDMKVKIFHHKWCGLGFSRNVVVNNSSGKYIIWVDGDMIIPRGHVKKQVEFMEKNPKVGIGKAKFIFSRRGKLLEILENIPFIVQDLKDKPLSLKLPGTGGAIFRVKAIRQVGGFDEHLFGVGEDQDAAFRIKTAGWSIERTHASFYERREQSWKDLLSKYFWYGYGNYKLYCKNKEIFKPIRMTPLGGFLSGAMLSIDVYKLKLKVRRILLLLLPVHFSLKMFAWCLGFIKGKIDSKIHNTI